MISDGRKWNMMNMSLFLLPLLWSIKLFIMSAYIVTIQLDKLLTKMESPLG